jgi:hypothetical protein
MLSSYDLSCLITSTTSLTQRETDMRYNQYGYNQSESNFDKRENIVQAFSEIISDLIDEGRDAYFMNFMFNQLPGSRKDRMAIMVQQVERVHFTLARHMLHDPKRRACAHLRPIFIGTHDLPVFKWDHGQSQRLNVANDGLHFNLVALVPPHKNMQLPKSFRYFRWGPQQRLRVPLDEHFRDKERFYVNDWLAKIHVTPVTRGTMADYTLKTYKHGRVDEDSLLILK